MSDSKISALSSASGLTGTEVLPVVQGGATKKVAVTALLEASLIAASLSNATGNLDLDLSDFNLTLPGVDLSNEGIWAFNDQVNFTQLSLFQAGIYADGPSFDWNDGGVHFGYDGSYIFGALDLSNSSLTLPEDVPRLDGSSIYGGIGDLEITGEFNAASNIATGGFFFGDGSNVTNVPPPAGLYIDSGGFVQVTSTSGIYAGDDGLIGSSLDVNGDFWVGGDGPGGTQLLSGPNTLGPLDGSALTGYAGSFSVGNANTAVYADYAGSASSTNTVEGAVASSIFLINGASYYPHVTAGVLTFTDTP